MPRKKLPKDMTTEEIAKRVFRPKLHQKLREKIAEIEDENGRKTNSKSSLQD